MKIKFKHIILYLCLPFIGWSTPALSHGTSVEYESVQALKIQARYNGGQPMREAQVTVYSPEDPATPWKQGETDSEGVFTFTPDPTQSGNWEVRVRQAGHGSIITIPIEGNNVTEPREPKEADKLTATEAEEDSLTLSQGNSNYTPTQEVLLGIAGVWGFFGTALFFARKKVD